MANTGTNPVTKIGPQNEIDRGGLFLLNKLGYDALTWFQSLYDQFGNEFDTACLDTGGIPHPVHFREGMTIRNMLRDSGLFPKWDSHDFDNNWGAVVKAALDFCHGDRPKPAA